MLVLSTYKQMFFLIALWFLLFLFNFALLLLFEIGWPGTHRRSSCLQALWVRQPGFAAHPHHDVPPLRRPKNNGLVKHWPESVALWAQNPSCLLNCLSKVFCHNDRKLVLKISRCFHTTSWSKMQLMLKVMLLSVGEMQETCLLASEREPTTDQRTQNTRVYLGEPGSFIRVTYRIMGLGSLTAAEMTWR